MASHDFSQGDRIRAGKAGDFKTERARLNSFEHGGHADRVGAEFLQHANFGRRFVMRSRQSRVNTFVEDDVDLARGIRELFSQLRRVGVS